MGIRPPADSAEQIGVPAPKPSWLGSLPSGQWRVHTPAGYADIYPAPQDLHILERNASLLADTAECGLHPGEVLASRIIDFFDELLARCVATWELMEKDGNPLLSIADAKTYEERLEIQRLIDQVTCDRLLEAWLWLDMQPKG